MTKYAVSIWGDLVVVRMDGELESRSCPELEAKIAASAKPDNKIVFNMENIDFIDSQGVVFLLRMRDLVEGNRGMFSIYNMKPYVERVIRRLKLERILNVYWSAEECFAVMAALNEDENISMAAEANEAESDSRRMPEAVGGVR